MHRHGLNKGRFAAVLGFHRLLEPIKGNFSNVAKLRGGGPIIGPTNYHAYQPTLRRLYEERFSRRMSFPEFMRDEVQIVNDEQTIAENAAARSGPVKPEPTTMPRNIARLAPGGNARSAANIFQPFPWRTL